MKNRFALASLALFAFFVISCSSPSLLPTLMPSPSSPPSSPTPSTVPNADAAIALVKSQFAEVAQVQKTPAGAIGASQNIFVFERTEGWDIAFWQGDGDCPAGCINNHYWYFSVKRDGRLSQMGEYVRIFDSQKNSFNISGVPMWGVPK